MNEDWADKCMNLAMVAFTFVGVAFAATIVAYLILGAIYLARCIFS